MRAVRWVAAVSALLVLASAVEPARAQRIGSGALFSMLAQEEPPVPPAIAGPPPPAPLEQPSREAALVDLRERNRSARTAVFMSAIVPGWGQLYADSPFWSVVAFSVQMYYLGNVLMESRRAERQSVRRDREPLESSARSDRDLLVTEHRERARDFVWWSAGGLLVIALDAYVSVELADFDSPHPPTPDLDKSWDLSSTAGGRAGAGLALRLDFAF